MPEVNEKAAKAFDDIINVIQLWEDGALTDEEMNNRIFSITYEYRHGKRS